MRLEIYYFALIALLISAAKAQVPYFGVCPAVRIVKDFDLSSVKISYCLSVGKFKSQLFYSSTWDFGMSNKSIRQFFNWGENVQVQLTLCFLLEQFQLSINRNGSCEHLKPNFVKFIKSFLINLEQMWITA